MNSKYLTLSDIYDEIQLPPLPTNSNIEDHVPLEYMNKNFIKNNTSPKAAAIFQPTYSNCINLLKYDCEVDDKEQSKDLCLTSYRSLRKKKYFQDQFEQKQTSKPQMKQLARSETVYSHYFNQKGIILTCKKSVPASSKSAKGNKFNFKKSLNDEIDLEPPIGRQSVAKKPRSMIN